MISVISESTNLEEYMSAPWLLIPSQSFEEWGINKHSRIEYYINQQIIDSLYSRFPTWKQSCVWEHFERLVNGILHDLRIIISGETSVILRIGTLHALQPKWPILREMLESITNLGYGYYPIFADRVNLILFYKQQAEMLVEQILKYKDFIFDIDLCRTNEVCIDGEPVESAYSTFFKTSINDSYIKNCQRFLVSLDQLPVMLSNCAFSQTYYLFKNTHSLYENVEIFQKHDFSIYHTRRSIFLQEYNNKLKTLSRKENVPDSDNNPKLREDAFIETMHRLYAESSQLYEEHRSMLEYQNDGVDHTEEGRLRIFFTNLFQTRFVGEQCDAEGKITKVLVDENGNTTVEGISGWNRWLDFLTVIALVREYEQKCMSASCMMENTMIVNKNAVNGIDHLRFPKCLSTENSISLYMLLKKDRFIDGNKTPLADFNYLMGAADQYTTPGKPKPICWLKNKQMLREMLLLAFAPLINNGSTKKSIIDFAPHCFVDKKGKPQKLGKNDERQIVLQDINSLKSFFATITRPGQFS